jgi:hypothetical protein
MRTTIMSFILVVAWCGLARTPDEVRAREAGGGNDGLFMPAADDTWDGSRSESWNGGEDAPFQRSAGKVRRSVRRTPAQTVSANHRELAGKGGLATDAPAASLPGGGQPWVFMLIVLGGLVLTIGPAVLALVGRWRRSSRAASAGGGYGESESRPRTSSVAAVLAASQFQTQLRREELVRAVRKEKDTQKTRHAA